MNVTGVQLYFGTPVEVVVNADRRSISANLSNVARSGTNSDLCSASPLLG